MRSSVIVVVLLAGGTALTVAAAAPPSPAPRAADASKGPPSSSTKGDPAAWGSNHVGKPVPEFVHGDECLFCHRDDIGSTWQKDPHAQTVRDREDAPELKQVLAGQPALATLTKDIQYFLGSQHDVRFLQKEGFGKFALLSSRAVLEGPGKAKDWVGIDNPVWNKDTFADNCAGCHTTGVDPKSRTFSAFGLDCYACHGDVDLEHSKDPARVFLSKSSARDPRAITSACAQCHLRTGRSRTTGLPYANNFVAGDNLFQDFQLDFARADDATLSVGDRHVLHNVEDVVLDGSDTVTCISCHQVHGTSSVKHRWLPRSALCADCHEASMRLKAMGRDHSAVCEY